MNSGASHFPGSLLGAPVMDGAGTIYLVASDRRLYALTQWGEFRWSLPLQAQPTTTAIARDGTVLVGTADGKVIAVNPNGDVVWSRMLNAPVSGVSVGADEIVAATADGRLIGLSAAGRELWRESTGVGLDSSPLIRGSGLLAFAADGTLVLLHRPVGVIERFSVGTAGAAVLARDGSVYLGGRDWVLYAFPRPPGAERITGPWPQAGHDEQHSGRTPFGPPGGVDAALNANPDYLYLESLAGSGGHDPALLFLSEVRSRLEAGSLGKSTWYVVRILEQLAGTGLIDPIYRNQKVINDFPDLRAQAASLLGAVGSAGSRWALMRVAAAETDNYALSEEIRALGSLAFDGDGVFCPHHRGRFCQGGNLTRGQPPGRRHGGRPGQDCIFHGRHDPARGGDALRDFPRFLFRADTRRRHCGAAERPKVRAGAVEAGRSGSLRSRLPVTTLLGGRGKAMKTGVVTLFALLCAALAFGLQVDKDELNKGQGTNIVFINYVGPHTTIDTLQQILGIGQALGQGLGNQPAEHSYNGKYRLIHAVGAPEGQKLDADIFIIEPGAEVDDVINVIRMVSGYLQSAYAYSAADAMVLARFVVYYNAVFRGDMKYFGAVYKTIVMKQRHR